MSLKNIIQYHSRRYSRLSLFIILVSALPSCKKFLDEKQNSRVSSINTPKDCLQILDYLATYSRFPSDGVTSSDEYYLSDADFDATDQDTRKIYAWDPESARISSDMWLFSYDRIYSANVVLESLDEMLLKNKAIEHSPEFGLAKGFALFMRSYRFYCLAQIYAAPYKQGAENDGLGIPLRSSSDFNVVSVRSTVKQTYEQIIKDVRDAIPLLPESTIIATRPDKSTAYAFLARVYLAMGDYGNAGDAANTCLSMNGNADRLINYKDISKTSATPFNRFMKEVLFHTTINMSVTTKKIDPDLYSSYEERDLRKAIFFKQNTGSAAGTYFFTGNYESSTSSYFNGIGIDEVYLIRAECYARANKPNEAMGDLNKLLAKRWDGVYTDKIASSASDALNQVLTERKKELVMRDLRWSDLRRLNQESGRALTIKRKVRDIEYVLPPNDLRYTLLLPEPVILFGKLPQNPR